MKGRNGREEMNNINLCSIKGFELLFPRGTLYVLPGDQKGTGEFKDGGFLLST